MGWGGGTEIFDCVAEDLLALNQVKHISQMTMEAVLTNVLAVLEDHDWDNLGESNYWDHPVIGKILGNDFEEDDD